MTHFASPETCVDRLLRYDGRDHLVEEIRKQAFPLQSEEASELFRQGQLITGPLAKQPGEPMLWYIATENGGGPRSRAGPGH